ncbi:hypothetical protein [Timonella sp. A28]|uniref:hypothetical protein n=1 Tax=Timonella sp. A28 TaxID=3442640 RepID=UPI003EB7E439
MGSVTRVVGAVVIAAGATIGVRKFLDRNQIGDPQQWMRTNHRDEPISLLEGPSVAAGAAAGSLIAGSPYCAERAAQVVATLGAGAFGLYDDLKEDTSTRAKGLSGHLAAFREGTLTTGGLKVLGIGASAFVASVFTNTGKPGRNVFDVFLDAAAIAGAANLMNLLDLRPGRALKVTIAAGALLTLSGRSAGGPLLGAAAAAWNGDLQERDMLGDCGANALGALVGTAFTQNTHRGTRVLGVAGIVGLTLASERVSFSQVIVQTPWLNTVDMLGRRPAQETQSAPTVNEQDSEEPRP